MTKQDLCVLFLRGSSKKVLDCQEQACREFARERNADVHAVFRERQRLDLSKRKVLRWMRTFCRNNPEVKFVLAFRERSISKNASELYIIKLLLQKIGVPIIFVRETRHQNF